MRKDELRQMTRQDLLDLARRHEIKGRSGMSKDALVEALAALRAPAQEKSERGAPRKSSPATRSRASVQPRSAQDAGGRGDPQELREEEPPAENGPRSAAPADAVQRRAAADDPRPSRASVPEEDPDEEDGQKWNSTALGRDPNYGRFLSPGSIAPRQPSPRQRRPGGPVPPVPSESLAERSERGRQRAVERSHGMREDLRRNGEARRGSPYVSRYGRPGEGRQRNDFDRGRAEGRREHGRSGDTTRTRGGAWQDRDRRPTERDRRSMEIERRLAELDRRRRERSERAHPERERPEHRGNREAPRDRNLPGPLQPTTTRRDAIDQQADTGRERNLLPPGQPPLEPPPVQGHLEGTSMGLDAEDEWESSESLQILQKSEGGVPRSYGLDHCRLMVRDPHSLHAYWEVREQTLQRLQRDLGEDWTGHRKTLRVHGCPAGTGPDQPGSDFFDIDLTEDANNWYITVPHAGRMYRADVGILTRNGLFYPLTASNTVVTPRNGASPEEEAEWAAPPSSQPASREAGGASGIEPSSEEASPGRGIHTAASAPEATGHLHAPDPPAPEVVTPQALPGGPGILPGATPVPSSPFPGRPLQHPAAPAAIPEEESLARSSGAPNPVLAVPETDDRADAGRRFWFVLNAELIVYGATEPDARVSFDGTPVRLEPDGTFALRFQLPDGTRTFECKAVSADGSAVRRISPSITRRTDSEEDLPQDRAATERT